MSNYTLADGREIFSEVLLKLPEKALADLPMACKACPEAMWHMTGTAENVKPRCFCRVMHAFTWPTKAASDEILDCDLLYQEDEEEYPVPSAPAPTGHELPDLQPAVPDLNEDDLLGNLNPLAGLEDIPE
ncbi:hypothetical protein D3C76_759590 [compost metagenome]